ncbi:MAG: NAD-glutamate dehydrogenase domain-containing protein, partial [Sciscionella sp.]
ASGEPELAELIRLYYRYVPPEEVIDDDPVDLVGAVRSHRQLAKLRAPGRPAVRVLNPSREADGWSCAATVVQVVTDDMPYLVDSVISELTRAGFVLQRLAHPIVVVRRDVAGTLREVLPTADPARPPDDAAAESWMHLEIDGITDPERARELENRLGSVLGDVREVVEDSEKMIGTARALADSLEAEPPPIDPRDVADGARLLRWLASGHFTFLGYRHYELVSDTGASGKDGGAREPGFRALRAILASGLGVLRSDSLAARSLTAGPDSGSAALSPELLVLTQAGAPSTVHRSVYPYYVGVKTFDASSQVTGEHRFLGVLNQTALHENVLDIPVVDRRAREVIHRAGFPLESYSGQKMLEVIQTYPRAELFSTDVQSLYDTVTGVLALADRRRLRLFLRRDPYGRFYSCLVYLPRDRYTTTSRLAMQQVLIEELDGRHLEYSARAGETEIARVHFMVHTEPGGIDAPDHAHIQRRLGTAIRSWDDLMIEAVLAERHDGEPPPRTESASEQGQRFAAAFPEAYKEDFSAADGLVDLRRLQRLDGSGGLDMSFYVPADAEPGERRFKLYLAGERVTLSKVLPVLQRMGVEVVDERPYEVHRGDGTQCWIFDFGLRIEPAVLERFTDEQVDDLRVRFQDTFAAAWRGACETDRFNSLVLRSGMNWRQASVLRAYVKYLRQAGTPYSQDHIEEVVLGHTDVATALLQLFEARFDLARSEADRISITESLVAELSEMIDEVTSLEADRILRSLLALIRATLRTTYHVTDAEGTPRPYLAFKLEPGSIPNLPEPRPRFEIFVYSPRMRGVHLRFGPVARGGLRWSDRREDFRTEILGLAKAQAVKNAVIVPVGAKGGFVVRRPPAATGDPVVDRQAQLAEGIACYRTFVSGLLDLTDNLGSGSEAGTVLPAPGVVRYDGDDTYLVVAADKGTATFSDIANDVAASYGFWLGDAFASGGSVGYDHKGMGITAKGAWESVVRHFR